jgi:hypothetical protein
VTTDQLCGLHMWNLSSTGFDSQLYTLLSKVNTTSLTRGFQLLSDSKATFCLERKYEPVTFLPSLPPDSHTCVQEVA